MTTMNSVRLNQNMRDAILQRMLDHAFGARSAEIVKLKREFAGDVYDEVYPPKTRAILRRVPAGFLPTTSGFQVIFAGQYTTVHWGEERPAAEKDLHRAVGTYSAEHSFSVRHFEIEKTEARLREERGRALGAARAALRSCTTVKQLVEVWPEAAPFVKAFTAPPQQKALTLNIESLNKQLGLSSEAPSSRQVAK
jgi:hypothetical protein